MYYPYLRAKQYELLALREFAGKYSPNNRIVPIIEPVKKQMNGLNTAISNLIDSNLLFAIVLNPDEGDFKHPSVGNDILAELPILASVKQHWIPAYIYKSNSQRLLDHARYNDLSNLMIIIPSSADIDSEDLSLLLTNDLVSYIVCEGLGNNRSLRSRLRKLGKKLISLEDRFNSKPRNADYADHLDELFSEDFAYYEDDGLAGFSDYTPMPKDYVEGGMLPYAIAIHLTYQKTDDQIFVHHFVSDSNFDQANIRGKFHEAAIKIAPFFTQMKMYRTAAVSELIDRSSSDDGYPGLGYLKKLSILNHLELMHHLLPQ
ncbi:MAG: sce7725 family protein [Muribaculaceae bacterium]